MGLRPVRFVRVAPSPVAIALALALLAAPAARSQEIVRQWFGDSANQRFGSLIAWVGDVNADGFMDIGVAAPYDSTVFAYCGMLRVISGKDGAVLDTFYGDAAGASLGTLGQPIGDVDLDGYDDILVSEPNWGIHPPYLGRIFVYSGKDGSELRRFTGTTTRRLNGSICGTGDIDGDGVPDLAASSSSGDYVTLFSGATKAEIRTLTASDSASTYFGHGLLNPGDIDGDGVNDLIVLENGCVNPADMNYYAFSGATGATLWQTQASTYCGSGSWVVRTCLSPVVLGDINGDGIADWAMGRWKFFFYAYYDSGFASCFSGKDGARLFDVFQRVQFRSPPDSSFGTAIAAAGDVNGDGVPDIAGSDFLNHDDPGGDVFFFSGVDGTILFHAAGSTSAVRFGGCLAGGLDCDGDGRSDLFAGDDSDSTNGPGAGAVTQLHMEPLILDIMPRYIYYPGVSDVLVDGGIPGNPVAIFLADLNGSSLFDLVEVDTLNPARRLHETWYVPNGLTGTTATFVAVSIDANGRLLFSNDETLTIL